MDVNKFKKTFRILRILQVLITVLCLLYALYLILVVVGFISYKLPTSIYDAITLFYWIILALFLIVNWTQKPFGRKGKLGNTLLLILLGFIGMWLWLPDKKEQSKIINSLKTLE